MMMLKLRAAIDALEIEAFSRQDISVLGSAGEMRGAYDTAYRDPRAIEDDPNAPRGSYVMPEEQSLAEACLVGAGIILAVYFMGPLMGAQLDTVGSVIMLLLFALIGGGIGYGAALLLRRIRRQRKKDQLRKGGLLLWVNTPTRRHERQACDILSRHGAQDVHINEVVRSAAA
jgi:hypothetical protein